MTTAENSAQVIKADESLQLITPSITSGSVTERGRDDLIATVQTLEEPLPSRGDKSSEGTSVPVKVEPSDAMIEHVVFRIDQTRQFETSPGQCLHVVPRDGDR